MQLIMQITISVVLGILGISVLILSLRWLRSGNFSKRLVQYVEAPLEGIQTRANMVRMQPRVITGSFTSRTFLPAIRWVGRLFGRITPASSIENLAKKLLIAGNPLSLGAREFYGIGMASTLLGVYLAFLVIQRGTDTLNVVLSIFNPDPILLFPKSMAAKPG